MATYIAESVHAYGTITDYNDHPTTDEGWAAAQPVTVFTGPDETITRHNLAMHLITSTSGMGAARQKIYYAASEAIVAGVDAVQISGRVYRIRVSERP